MEIVKPILLSASGGILVTGVFYYTFVFPYSANSPKADALRDAGWFIAGGVVAAVGWGALTWMLGQLGNEG